MEGQNQLKHVYVMVIEMNTIQKNYSSCSFWQDANANAGAICYIR